MIRMVSRWLDLWRGYDVPDVGIILYNIKYDIIG